LYVVIPTGVALVQEFFEILSACPLFQGIAKRDIPEMLHCLGGKTAEFGKGTPVFLEGDPAGLVGVVLSGEVHIVREDYYGNRSVITVVQPGSMFAEAFACANLDVMPVSAIAVQPSTVLLLDCRRAITTCENTCQFHNQLIGNLLQETAKKNLLLTQKIRYMSQKTTKEKVMAFLLDQAKKQKCSAFTIPYDRQALADYLGVERSAMSAEISKLKKSGFLDTNGSWFSLKHSCEKCER
jgi:CRP-like cAMP-binding protein